MKALVLLFSTILLSFSCLGAHEETVHKTFTLDNSGQLTLQLESASVDLQAASGNEVDVVITYSMRGAKDDFEKELSKIDLNFDETDKEVSVEMKYPHKERWFSFFRSKRLDIHVAVKVPAGVRVDASTSGGNVDAKGITKDGLLKSSGGNITLLDCEGNWEAYTSGGSIQSKNGEGDFLLKTSGGSITGEAHQGALNMYTSGGSIRVRDSVGALELRTSGSGIRLSNISGVVDARTSGGSIKVDFADILTGDCSLRTSGGSIQVSLPASCSFNLDAGTSGGSVDSEFPVEVSGKLRHDKLAGPVNGGGPLLHAKTSGGGIRIKNS